MKHHPITRLALFMFLLTLALPAQAMVGDVRTWMSHSYAGDGGDARQAWLDNPGGFAADSACTLYIADSANNVIRRVDGATNIITTFAGSGHYGSTDGIKLKASFSAPEDTVLGPNGELYVTDAGSGKIRLIKNGIVTTPFSHLHAPTGLLLNGSTLYISEKNSNRILTANVTTGTATVLTTISGPGKMALLGSELYVIHNTNTRLSKISLTTGVVTAIKTDFINIEGVAVSNSEIYVVAGDNGLFNELWKYTPSSGNMTRIANVPETEWYNHQSDVTFCGSSMRILFRAGSSVYTAADADNANKIAGIHRWGDRDGLRSVALVGRPSAMVLSKDKTKFYLLENQKIKVFDLVTKTLSFLAGHANDNYTDGTGNAARVSGPVQMVLSKAGGQLFIADRNNNRIRVLNVTTGAMTTLTGAGKKNMFNGQNNAYAEGGPCPNTLSTTVASCAYFSRPTGIALSRDGSTLYVSDTSNSRIRKVNVSTGQTSLLAGGIKGFKDDVGSLARFNRPGNLLLSKDGTKLYVVDLGNHSIRQIDLATKLVHVLVGHGRPGYLNGPISQAVLSYPDALAQGPGNTLFLSEVGSQRIRRINLDTKTVSLLAGSGRRGLRNGTALQASFSNPKGMLMINSTLLVADSLNDLIRSVNLK